LKSFDIKCLSDGSFDVPDDDEWLNCITSKIFKLHGHQKLIKLICLLN
jgi:hypothetical protein